MAALSTMNDHLVVEGVNHASMVADEVEAAATGADVLNVVFDVRAGPTPG